MNACESNETSHIVAWAKVFLPKDINEAIKRSSAKVFRLTLAVVITVFILLGISIVVIVTSIAKKPENQPANSTERRAFVDYDQHLCWTFEKKSYEADLADCNLDVTTKPYTHFTIYVDNSNGQLIKVLLEDPDKYDDFKIILLMVIMVMAVIFLVVFYLVMKRQPFALPWYQLLYEYRHDEHWDSYIKMVREITAKQLDKKK